MCQTAGMFVEFVSVGVSDFGRCLVGRHLWVKGNLPLGSECCVCSEDVDQTSELGLFGQRCFGCQKAAHDKCFSKISGTLCDFGEFRSMIFPPKCILASRSKWNPLIVVGKFGLVCFFVFQINRIFLTF